jgi:hypothetical protein
LAKLLATGLYLFGLAAGLLTLGGGCGSREGPEVIVPAKVGVSDEEKKGRMEAMKKAEEEKRRAR